MRLTPIDQGRVPRRVPAPAIVSPCTGHPAEDVKATAGG